MMPTTSATLLQCLRDRRDGKAWGRFVDLYEPLVRTWLRRHLPQSADVDDLTQQVLTVVVEKFPTFEHVGRTGAFRAWLRSISVNRLRVYWRSRPGTSQFDPEPLLSQLEDPQSELSQQWDREHDAYVTQRAMQRLESEFKPTTWQAFRRLVVDGVDAETVAAELGVTVNAASIAKSRVLRRLREELTGFVL